MKNFYVKVDSSFLNGVDSPHRERLEKIFEEHDQRIPGRSHYLRLCPYCNGFFLLSMSEGVADELVFPSRCVICGESNPFEKIQESFGKADTLYGLSVFCACGDDDEDDIKNERTLLEQTIVVLATGFEIFMRDLFCSGMNLKFVKNGRSLFSKFSVETKNDFINIGKATEKFKKELDIDLKTVFSKDEIGKIKILLLKRNVIVHNNGFVDTQFKNQSGMECQIGQPIHINAEEVSEYISILETVVDKLETEFEAILSPEIDLRLKEFLNE